MNKGFLTNYNKVDGAGLADAATLVQKYLTAHSVAGLSFGPDICGSPATNPFSWCVPDFSFGTSSSLWSEILIGAKRVESIKRVHTVA